jgi:hypothetical protein
LEFELGSLLKKKAPHDCVFPEEHIEKHRMTVFSQWKTAVIK